MLLSANCERIARTRFMKSAFSSKSSMTWRSLSAAAYNTITLRDKASMQNRHIIYEINEDVPSMIQKSVNDVRVFIHRVIEP